MALKCVYDSIESSLWDVCVGRRLGGAHEGTGAAVLRVERPLVVGVAGSGGQDRGLSFRSGRRLQM